MSTTPDHVLVRPPDLDDAIVNWAIYYVSVGQHVVPVCPPGNPCRYHTDPESPCTAPGKRPIGSFHDAATDTDAIQQIWTRYPDASVGILAKNCSILDIDNETAFELLLEEFRITEVDLGEPVVQTTGSGKRHLFFDAMGKGDADRLVKWFAGCGEARVASNGIVVVCPSLHSKTRKPYTWIIDDELGQRPLPKFPLHLLPPADKVRREYSEHIRKLVTSGEPIEPGWRHKTLCAELGRVIRVGIGNTRSDDEISEAIFSAADVIAKRFVRAGRIDGRPARDLSDDETLSAYAKATAVDFLDRYLNRPDAPEAPDFLDDGPPVEVYEPGENGTGENKPTATQDPAQRKVVPIRFEALTKKLARLGPKPAPLLRNGDRLLMRARQLWATFGIPGSSKTYLKLILAASLRLSRPFFGFEPVRTEGMPVLLVLLESTAEEIQERLTAIGAEELADDPYFGLIVEEDTPNRRLNLVASTEAMVEEIRRLEAGFVLLDSLACLMPPGKSDARDTDVEAVIDSMRTIISATDATLDVLQHENKREEVSRRTKKSDQAAMRGAGQWMGTADGSVRLIVPAEGRHLRCVSFAKTRRDREPDDFWLEVDPETGALSGPVEAPGGGQRGRKQTQLDEIEQWACERSAAFCVGDVMNAFGTSEPTARRRVQQLVRGGRIGVVSKGHGRTGSLFSSTGKVTDR